MVETLWIVVHIGRVVLKMPCAILLREKVSQRESWLKFGAKFNPEVNLGLWKPDTIRNKSMSTPKIVNEIFGTNGFPDFPVVSIFFWNKIVSKDLKEKSFILGRKPCVIYFHSKICKYCRKLSRIWEDLERSRKQLQMRPFKYFACSKSFCNIARPFWEKCTRLKNPCHLITPSKKDQAVLFYRMWIVENDDL